MDPQIKVAIILLFKLSFVNEQSKNESLSPTSKSLKIGRKRPGK